MARMNVKIEGVARALTYEHPEELPLGSLVKVPFDGPPDWRNTVVQGEVVEGDLYDGACRSIVSVVRVGSAAPAAELGLEYDVCEDGVIVSEHGTDAAEAVTEATRLRLASDAPVVTILVTSAASREANS